MAPARFPAHITIATTQHQWAWYLDDLRWNSGTGNEPALEATADIVARMHPTSPLRLRFLDPHPNHTRQRKAIWDLAMAGRRKDVTITATGHANDHCATRATEALAGTLDTITTIGGAADGGLARNGTAAWAWVLADGTTRTSNPLRHCTSADAELQALNDLEHHLNTGEHAPTIIAVDAAWLTTAHHGRHQHHRTRHMTRAEPTLRRMFDNGHKIVWCRARTGITLHDQADAATRNVTHQPQTTT